jgi:hypothetical protein
MLAYAEQCLASMLRIRLCGAQLTYADVCADVCLRMLSNAADPVVWGSADVC